MKEVPAEEAKLIMLQILREVATFCDENNIVYYLAYGTLIGAIRHNGFIPWDDDIDIMMPRPDYERFVDLYHKKGKYGISSPLVDKGCFLIYSKIYDKRTVKYENGIDYNRYPALGVDIDVFPLDGIPKADLYPIYLKECKHFLKLGKLLTRTISPHKNHCTIFGKIAGFTLDPLCRFLGKDFFIRKAIAMARKYKYSESDYVHVAFPILSCIDERYEKKDFETRIKVTFEKEIFWAPAGYDSILRAFYGDYMQLPPVEERQTHHLNQIYWKE